MKDERTQGEDLSKKKIRQHWKEVFVLTWFPALRFKSFNKLSASTLNISQNSSEE